MSEGSSDEAESSSVPFNTTLGQLSHLLAVSRYDQQQARILVDRIVSIGSQYGFTDHQATQVAQLALRGASDGARGISSQISTRLLKSIHPASNEQFGDEFVYTIISALGPTGDVVIDANLGLDREAQTDDRDEFSSDSDEDESSKRRKRRKVAVGVQAAALRLLVLLLIPPPVVTFASDDIGSEPTTTRLTIRFLSSKARRTLDRCYDILFHYLDYQTLRPHLCHLLCLTTRRKHIRHHRIVKLLSLRNIAPEDSNINALISLCSKYYPELHAVNASISTSTAVLNPQTGGIRYPDSKWLLLVNDIWTRSERGHSNGIYRASIEEEPFRKRRKGGNILRSKDRAHNGDHFALSIVTSLLPSPSVLTLREGSTLILEVMTFKGLGYLFDRLQLPDHLVCALIHPMSRIAVLSEGQSSTMEDKMARISYWAISAASEEMNLPSSKMIRLHDIPLRSKASQQKSAAMLMLLGNFVLRVGACPATLQCWISRLLQPSVWTSLSIEEKRAVLTILESFVPCDWSEFSTQTITPLTVLIKSSSAYEAALIIDSLRGLLDRWLSSRNWMDISLALEAQRTDVYFGFCVLSPEVDYIETISQTIETSMNLASTVLVHHSTSLDVINAILDLFECIFTKPFFGLHDFQLPPRFPLHLISLTQYGSVGTLSRLLTIMSHILAYHVDFISTGDESEDDITVNNEHGSERITKSQRSFYSEESRNAFNNCSIYLSDLIWRANAFGTVQIDNQYDVGLPKSFFDQLEERCNQRGDEMVKIGSVSHSAILGPLMESHALEVDSLAQESIQGPITPHSLLQARLQGSPIVHYRRFRDKHLNWLEKKHARGYRDFFHLTLRRWVMNEGFD